MDDGIKGDECGDPNGANCPGINCPDINCPVGGINALGKGDAKDHGVGGINGPAFEPPTLTDMGAVSEALEGEDTCTSIPVPCVDGSPDAIGLSSSLFSTGIEGLLLAGALVPFRPLPFGISAVTNFVKLGIFIP